MVKQNLTKKQSNPTIVEKDLRSAIRHKFRHKIMLISNLTNANLPIAS